MLKVNPSFICRSFIFILAIHCYSCKKLNEYNQKPELESLQQGLKLGAAIGYCVSVATSAYKGYTLPSNVIYEKGSGLIYIKVDNNHPLPFNRNIGDIVIAGQWKNGSGVMSILFGNIDILGGNIKLYGLYLIPFIERDNQDGILAFMAKQDVILGNGSDTILNLSNLTSILFDSKINNLNAEKPTDAFVAVKQNVWFVNIDQRNTYTNVYDDVITISGGGQIAEIKGESGGVVYHAVIDAKVDFAACRLNPVSGYALSQNFKAGGEPYIDLGNSLLRFHDSCDGNAHVELSTGKYVTYNGKDISLNVY